MMTIVMLVKKCLECLLIFKSVCIGIVTSGNYRQFDFDKEYNPWTTRCPM